MCGFVGEIRFDDKQVNIENLQKRADIIHHRGPDDNGLFECGWAGLAFKRLAIMDLSQAGHQPMASEDNRYTIVFNGEIYNFKEIRAELEALGGTFKSNSDTEVVLQSFIQWGNDCFSKFIGMFAIIIIDQQEELAYVARDHLGIKPLYSMRYEDTIHYASEIKAFRPIKSFELNANVLYEQLSFGYVAGKHTLFKDIYKVEPGSLTIIDKKGNQETIQFYDSTKSLLTPEPDVNYSAIETAIDDSIRRHTLSDVGYNLQLSGGIDSSYIVATLVGEEKKRINTYSVTIDGIWNEESYQKEVISQYPTNHHSYHYGGDELADIYAKATWHMDAPNMHLASPFLMMLCGESAKTSKVILTGEGADELLGGYDRFRIDFLQRLGNVLYRMKIPAWLIPNIPKIRALKPYLAENPVFLRQRLISKQMSDDLISPYLSKDLSTRNNYLKDYTKLEDKMIVSHQKCYLQSILERQDRISMAASVEARVPFCSPPLFDLINPLPYNEKLKSGVTKAILKKLAEKFFNHDFIHRRKSGFTLPIDEWLNDEKGMGRYLKNLEQAPFVNLPYFNHVAIQSMLNDRKSGRKSWHKELMILINFDIWYQLFISETLDH